MSSVRRCRKALPFKAPMRFDFFAVCLEIVQRRKYTMAREGGFWLPRRGGASHRRISSPIYDSNSDHWSGIIARVAKLGGSVDVISSDAVSTFGIGDAQ
jgi:hypothetical protein